MFFVQTMLSFEGAESKNQTTIAIVRKIEGKAANHQ
jgi:hypothetical protein